MASEKPREGVLSRSATDKEDMPTEDDYIPTVSLFVFIVHHCTVCLSMLNDIVHQNLVGLTVTIIAAL